MKNFALKGLFALMIAALFVSPFVTSAQDGDANLAREAERIGGKDPNKGDPPPNIDGLSGEDLRKSEGPKVAASVNAPGCKDCENKEAAAGPVAPVNPASLMQPTSPQEGSGGKTQGRGNNQ